MIIKIKKYIYVIRNIKWKGSHTEFVELIYALYQAGLIECIGRHNCKDKIVHNMAEFFGVEGIDNHASIHSNSIRKNKVRHLIDRLNNSYTEYIDKLINADIQRKKGQRGIVVTTRKRKPTYNKDTDLREADAEVTSTKSGIEIKLPPDASIDKNSEEYKYFEKEAKTQTEELTTTLEAAKKIKE